MFLIRSIKIEHANANYLPYLFICIIYMIITRKRGGGNNKTKKNKSGIAKIEENSFPTTTVQNPNQITKLYETEENSHTNGKKKLDIKDLNKVLQDKMYHIFYILDKQDIGFQPNKDFYTYSNMIWLNSLKKENELRYFTQFDNFRITQDKVYYKLIKYVNDYVKANKKKPLAKKMSNMLKSWTDLNPKSIQSHVDKMVVDIDELRKDPANLWKMLAYVSKNDLVKHSCPLKWILQADQKNSKVYANYITGPVFGLFDLEVYYQLKPEHAVEKKAYLEYIDTIFKTCLGANHGLKSSDVFDIELQIIDAYGCDTVKNGDPLYNKVTKKDALAKYGFDWAAY